MGLVGGFVGGVAAIRNAQTVTARQFVVVDQTGKARAVLAVLPERDAACSACDGRAHLVVLDEQGRQMMWPPTGPQLSPADLATILKFLMHF
jgi:hypothetical protein